MLATNLAADASGQRTGPSPVSASGASSTSGAGDRPSAQPCTLAALGFDPRALAAIEHLLKKQLADRFVLTQGDQADVVMIDLDSYGGKDLWAKHAHALPSRPLILLSVMEIPTDESTLYVRKPITPETLIAALIETHKGIARPSAPPKGSTPSAAAAAPPSPRPGTETRRAGQTAAEASRQVPPGDEPRSGAKPAVAAGNVGLRLAERDAKTFIGSAPDIDPDNPEQVAKAQFDPDTYLIGRLTRALALAKRSGRAVCLQLDHGAITLLPEAGQAVLERQHFQLRSLAGVPLTDPTTKARLVDAPDLTKLGARSVLPLEGLLWSAALLASRGRVPAGTDLTAPVRLKRWPNLTRLAVCPHIVRITALLSREPISLIGAARALGIPQRSVFAFYTAASALDLIDRPAAVPQERGSPSAAEPEKAEAHVKRGLLKRILAHLRR